MPNATVTVLASFNTHLLEWFISHYTHGEQKNPSGTTWLCLETTDGEKLPSAVERSSQVWNKWGLIWQAAHVTPTGHVGAEVSGLPFHWRPPEASSEGSTAH